MLVGADVALALEQTNEALRSCALRLASSLAVLARAEQDFKRDHAALERSLQTLARVRRLLDEQAARADLSPPSRRPDEPEPLPAS